MRENTHLKRKKFILTVHCSNGNIFLGHRMLNFQINNKKFT